MHVFLTMRFPCGFRPRTVILLAWECHSEFSLRVVVDAVIATNVGSVSSYPLFTSLRVAVGAGIAVVLTPVTTSSENALRKRAGLQFILNVSSTHVKSQVRVRVQKPQGNRMDNKTMRFAYG